MRYKVYCKELLHLYYLAHFRTDVLMTYARLATLMAAKAHRHLKKKARRLVARQHKILHHARSEREIPSDKYTFGGAEEE